MSELSNHADGVEVRIKQKPQVSVETRGFAHDEVLEISAHNIYLVSFGLGIRTKVDTQEQLMIQRKEPDYDELLEKSKQSLNNHRRLAKESADLFTTSDGVNHLERYLHTLRGFCNGAQITEEEGALLQIVDQLGCQSLLVQNTQTGEIAGIHTEEDETRYRQRKDSAWGKRWIRMKVEGRVVEFCSYAGICNWGGTSGVLEENGKTFYQSADSLNPTIEGTLWANAVSFMFMDAGKISLVEELVSKFKKIPPPIFSGGYVLHMVEGGKPPKMATVELGGNTIDFIAPEKSYDESRKVASGANFPRHKDLVLVENYAQPKQENESDRDYKERQEERSAMERRLRRLTLIGQIVGKRFLQGKVAWGEEEVLDIANKVIENSRGDVLGEWFSGLANYLVAQNTTLYVSPEGKMKLIVRKGSPEPRRKPTN